MDVAAIKDFFRDHRDAMIDDLRTLVEHESPSRDKVALDALAYWLSIRLAGLGGSVSRIANDQGGDHLLARFDAPTGANPALILGHFDTVWPLGTIDTRPFAIDGDRAYGPGSYDMKASLAIVFAAIGAIRATGGKLPRPVLVLLTSDEEIGSPTSRALIESTAKDAAYTLVIEPPLTDGSLKTARKGVGKFILTVTGRSAHAGVEPEKGVNAILELAHQVLRLHAMNDPAAGTSVNVGVISGGTTSNVVPAQARARVDVRTTTLANAGRLESAIRGLAPVLNGARLTVEGHFDRPPMERSPAVAALYQQARQIGRSLGLELGEGSTGGGSDGNFTAAMGIPTLDGLGAMGAGAHAESEHVVISSLPERAALLAMLLLSLRDAS